MFCAMRLSAVEMIHRCHNPFRIQSIGTMNFLKKVLKRLSGLYASPMLARRKLFSFSRPAATTGNESDHQRPQPQSICTARLWSSSSKVKGWSMIPTILHSQTPSYNYTLEVAHHTHPCMHAPLVHCPLAISKTLGNAPCWFFWSCWSLFWFC